MKVATFILARLMPVWIVLFALLAVFMPKTFQSWDAATNPAIGFVLFIMGLTIDRSRLKGFMIRPSRPLLGSFGKWLIASIVSIVLAFLFFGVSEISYGVIMSGIVPSGTSANLNSLIGRGDLALSMTMSAIDTFIGPLITPLLAKLFIGSSVHVDYLAFLIKIMEIVFLPLTVGMFLQWKFSKFNTSIKPYAPIASAIALYILVLGVAGNASKSLLQHASILPILILCVIVQIVLQMGLGYGYAKLLRFDESSCRSVLFEVGICNSALATVLANDAFGPLAGMASMANMLCNLTLGSLTAAILASVPTHRLKVIRGGNKKPTAKSL
ncbi:bile acid:sodium symporter family protein [Fodinisporobacter ferrooxydans]|uniref:Bile acid:sodium symporter family protein n=1 Tax=Fodinisporobacter ferrooxydans TaxID=2901836 RepID=A0ABY4CGV3_9BACL|nr:bile acid:sodium symporter family protein [Alicyclobacillaceae bacterium MYW30-H2]